MRSPGHPSRDGVDARQELERQASLLETLLAHAPIGLAFVDREFRFVKVNATLAAIDAWPGEDLIGRTVAEVAPQLWPVLEPLYRRALGGETIINHDVTGIAPVNGRDARHWLVSYYPIRGPHEVVGVGVIVNDVTDRTAALEALSARNALYAMLARTNRAVIQCRSVDELFQAVCRIAVDVGRFRFAWVGVPDGNRVKMVASAGDDGGYMDSIVITLDEHDPRSHGPTGRAAVLGRSFVVNDFKASSMTAPWHEQARRVGFAASAAFPLNERGRVVAVFTLYASTTGFFTTDLVETLNEITPSVSFALDSFVTEQDRLRNEAERRQIEEQYRQAQKMEAVGQLAGGVAHDFNNLLTVINGYSELLLSGRQLDDRTRELLGEIHHAGSRAGSLTRQLLAFSRQQVLELRELNLNTVVSETERMLRRLIGEDVALRTSLSQHLGLIRADAGQIAQILINLAVNARDAMPGGGELAIETSAVTVEEPHASASGEVPPGDYVLCVIRDTGHGMDDATKARIFEPFFTTKGVGRGTGLGLATVHGIVSQSGGYVAVDSEVGRGTTFRVYLPRIADALVRDSVTSTAAAQRDADSAAAGTAILLVEDDASVRAFASHVLRDHGYHVIEAADGLDAVHRCKTDPGPIHLLVTDVVMPHMGGRELAEKIVAMRPECRVLFLSGYADDMALRYGLMVDEHAFLQKPFAVAALVRKVRDVLNRA